MRARLISAARWLSKLLAALGLAFLVVTFTPVVEWIVGAITPAWDGSKGPVLIVLGGSMLVPGTGPAATMGHDTYVRCVYASWILSAHSFGRVLVTGNDGAAEAMAHFLRQNGVSEPIEVENRAGSTYENAVFSKELLRHSYGGQVPPVAVLTSDYHAWRAKQVFLHAGFDVRMIPVPDLRKRAGSLLERWPALVVIGTEFGKDSWYLLQGRL